VRCAFANTGALFQTEWTGQRRPNEVRRTGVELRKCGAEGGEGRSPTEQSKGGGGVTAAFINNGTAPILRFFFRLFFFFARPNGARVEPEDLAEAVFLSVVSACHGPCLALVHSRLLEMVHLGISRDLKQAMFYLIILSHVPLNIAH
jgi:hypothetical protein